MQFPSNSDQRWLLQPFFIISPISLFLASGLYLKHFFRIFSHGWATRYWGWPLEVIWYHFDRVVMWPPRSTLASGLFWLFWLKIAPNPSTKMQCPYQTFLFYFWGFLLNQRGKHWKLEMVWFIQKYKEISSGWWGWNPVLTVQKTFSAQQQDMCLWITELLMFS